MLQQQRSHTPVRRARILVLDDEPAVQQMVVRVLTEAGYDVTAVGDGWDGVSAASAGLPYDLVVTNTFVPQLTGDQLVGYLRRLYPSQPIVHLDDLARPIGPERRTAPPGPQHFRVTALLDTVAGVLAPKGRPALS
jgi:CheY-like chemotaxis protein